MRTDERHQSSAPPVQRILAILAGVVLLRILLRHGPAGSMRDRRRAMIAKLHRELHAAEDAAAAAPKGGATPTTDEVTA